MRDLVKITKEIIVEMRSKKEVDTNCETALQHLLLLICNLTFVDQSFLKQFFECCVPLRMFQMMKNILAIRTRNEPLSVVKYFISIVLRLYMIISESRKSIVPPLLNCVQGNVLLFIKVDHVVELFSAYSIFVNRISRRSSTKR